MADPLYEMLNRINADPQGGTAPIAKPHWTQQLLDAIDSANSWTTTATGGIDKVLANANPFRSRTVEDVRPGKALEDARTTAGQLARVPTDIVGGVVGLPNLPDTLSQVLGGPKIGRFESLDTASDAVHQAGQTVGEAIAGKPLNDSLINGTPSELSASWLRLLGGAALPLPGSWQAKLSSGLQKVSAGSTTADNIASTAIKTMEVLTPLTLNPKAAVANVGVAATLAPTLEMAVANHEQAKTQLQAGSDQTKGALDVAAQGATEARDAVAQRTVQASMLPSITGDDTTDAVIGASLLGAATLAQAKFNIAGRVLAGTKKALTSYDPNNPLDKTNMGTWDLIQQQLVNRNTTSETAFKKVLQSQGAPNIDTRVTQIKESNSMRTGASVDTRMKSFINDGELPDSVHKAAPINDFYVRLSQVDTAGQEALDRALLAQRELDTRRISKVNHDLYNTTSSDLQTTVDAVKNNPPLKQLFDDYLATNRVLSSYMDEQKRFTSAEIRSFLNKNPNFVASKITEPNGRWLDKREPTQFGGLETFEEMGSPTKLWPQYIDEVVRSTEGKKIQRDFFTEFMQAKGRNDPYAQQMIGRTLTDAPPHNSAGRFVHWRNGRGESRWTEVTDAAVRNSLQDATNPTALQLHKGWADATKWYENGAVGTMSAVTGSIFAPKSLLYARTFGTAFRPEGIAVSPLDKLMQTITNGKIGAPEPITSIPQDVWNAMNGVAAVLTQRGAVALHNSVLRDGPLAKTLDTILPRVPLGPNTARAAADGLATLYKRTGAYELQQRGLLGPGTFASVDPALSYREAESVLRSHGLLGNTKEAVTFVSDILHAITTAPAITTLQLNKGVNKATVSNAIRNMSGDPGAAGAFRGAEGIAKTVNTIPWGNIYLQSGFRMINGFKKNPGGAVAGIMTTAIMPEILSGLWSASLGPEYVDYHYNQRSPDQQASSIYIPIPGRLPSEGVEIPIDPWLRPFKHMGGLINASYLGLLDGSLYKPDNQVTLDAIKHAINHRQMGSPFAQGTVPHSLLTQTLMPPVPGPLVAGAAMAGIQLRGWDESHALPDKHNAGFTEGVGPKGNMFLEKYGPAHLEDIMRGIGAQAAANTYTMLNDTLTRRFSAEMGRNEGDQSWQEAAKQGVTANFTQKLKDSGRMLGTGSLFDSALAISPGMESSGVVVKEKLDGLRKMQEAFASATLSGGTPQTVVGDKKRGFQDYMGAASLGSADPTMDVLGREATRIYRELNTAYGGARKDLFDQRQSIANSSKFSPQLKRYMMNEFSDQIIQMDRRMLVDIERHEAVISQQLGVPVKFDKMNLNQGKGQFK